MAVASGVMKFLALSVLVNFVPMVASQWTTGRATWYDHGPLQQGNCHYDWSPTGRMLAAIPDTQAGFESSCGRCYEVRCKNMNFQDGYGSYLDRSHACYSESKTVIVMVADACPCKYPNNAYSNKRWCCGDMQHMDISEEAFRELADMGVGVIGVEWREVDCSSSPHRADDAQTSVGGQSGGDYAGSGDSGSQSSSGNFNWGGLLSRWGR